ncbi:MAG: hypothetical protein Q4F28_01435 [Eubacteriales bacterium]|nr:hypothetical protein [Eubacteriales bacterium]
MALFKSPDKKWKKRIISIFIIALGLVLGVTWSSKKICIGDRVFVALGLPAWTSGTSGTHYPAVVGAILILIGMGMLNTTLQKKSRFWLWTIVVLGLVILNFVLTI